MIDFLRDQKPPQRSSKTVKTRTAPPSVAYSFYRKGDSLFTSNRFALARAYYQKSLGAYRQAGDIQGAGSSLARLGRVAEILGEYPQARVAYEQSLGLFETLSDLPGIARSKAHLGNVGWATGQYDQASKYLDESLSFYRLGEDTANEAWVHDLIGNLRLAMREDEEAERSYRTSFALVEKLGLNLENTAWDHFHMGALAFFREEKGKAQERFMDALKCFEGLKDDLGRVASHIHLGELACAHNDLSEAEQHLQKAVHLVVPTQCKPLLADALTGVAQLLEAQGDERKAISILMVALSHPTCRQQTKDRMVTLAMDLKASFSKEEAERGFEWAKDVSIDEMASAWASSASLKTKAK